MYGSNNADAIFAGILGQGFGAGEQLMPGFTRGMFASNPTDSYSLGGITAAAGTSQAPVHIPNLLRARNGMLIPSLGRTRGVGFDDSYYNAVVVPQHARGRAGLGAGDIIARTSSRASCPPGTFPCPDGMRCVTNSSDCHAFVTPGAAAAVRRLAMRNPATSISARQGGGTLVTARQTTRTFTAPPRAPVASTWSCPDGTVCQGWQACKCSGCNASGCGPGGKCECIGLMDPGHPSGPGAWSPASPQLAANPRQSPPIICSDGTRVHSITACPPVIATQRGMPSMGYGHAYASNPSIGPQPHVFPPGWGRARLPAMATIRDQHPITAMSPMAASDPWTRGQIERARAASRAGWAFPNPSGSRQCDFDVRVSGSASAQRAFEEILAPVMRATNPALPRLAGRKPVTSVCCSHLQCPPGAQCFEDASCPPDHCCGCEWVFTPPTPPGTVGLRRTFAANPGVPRYAVQVGPSQPLASFHCGAGQLKCEPAGGGGQYCWCQRCSASHAGPAGSTQTNCYTWRPVVTEGGGTPQITAQQGSARGPVLPPRAPMWPTRLAFNPAGVGNDNYAARQLAGSAMGPRLMLNAASGGCIPLPNPAAHATGAVNLRQGPTTLFVPRWMAGAEGQWR